MPRMAKMKLWWMRLRGRSCDSCAFVDIFRSNGDGQVMRLHSFCRSPLSPFADRPVPPERLCGQWQPSSESPSPPRVGDPNLTV
jgi:hypothetical protein